MYLPKNVVFITGAFITHKCWDAWKAYFEAKGYITTAPPWPYKSGTVQELRDRRPNDRDLAALRLSQLVEHYADIIKAMPEKPIVVGHSLGGLIVQILVNRELVAAGVAIHSVPPKGVFSFEWPFLKAIWKPLGYFTSVNKTYMMSLKEWKHAFTNGMTNEKQLLGYEENAIPESKRVLRDALGKAAVIDFNKIHPPLLFITGSRDNIAPNSLNYENYIKYNKDHSITDYKEFNGKNHFVIGLPSWHDEADYILSWLDILRHN